MTEKQTPRSHDVPTGEEEGQLQEEMHHGIETVTEMADYGLTEEQKNRPRHRTDAEPEAG